ncbi:G2/M phase-specific E3 ubiquitin-protein ligase-like [Pimephales promelas]|nr:G2/M phase-specific E3 ubiquitin-protein ligase-like [Pimephales promelas]
MQRRAMSDPTRDAIEILRSVLSSPSLIQSIANSTEANVTPTSRSNTELEVQTLFRPSNVTPATASGGPRFHTRQQYGQWQARSRKRPRAPNHQTFNKDVVLLRSPTDDMVVKQRTKQNLHELGHILSAFEFNKSWDYTTVLQKIKDGFKEKIPPDVSLEILMGCGNKLITPKLSDGQQLTGSLILKVFRLKALYVRPSRALQNELDESDESCFEVDVLSSTSGQSSSSAPSSNAFSSASDQTFTSALSSTSGQSSSSALSSSALSSASDQTFTSALSSTSGQSSSSALSSSALSSASDQTFTSALSSTSGQSSSSALSSSALSSASDQTFTSALSSTSGQSSSSATGLASRSTQVSTTDNTPWESDYSTYLSLIQGFSEDEDEDLCSAIMASIEDQSIAFTEDIPIKQILKELSEKININQTSKFNINRAAVLDGAIRGFTRVSYNPNNRMVIRFSDDKGRYEEAIDLGGPRREFLRLLLAALTHSSMFEGKEGNLNLALDSQGTKPHFLPVCHTLNIKIKCSVKAVVSMCLTLALFIYQQLGRTDIL